MEGKRQSKFLTMEKRTGRLRPESIKCIWS
jgi:hypothetical protein